MGLCSDAFWNSSLTWFTDSPDFSICFQHAVFVLAPCSIFCIAAVFEIRMLARYVGCFEFPWLLTVLAKLILGLILICISILDLSFTMYQKYVGYDVPDVLFFSNCSRLTAYVLVVCLIILNKKHAKRSSTLLTVFWFIMSLCTFIMHFSSFRTGVYQASSGDQLVRYILDMVHFPMIYCQFSLSLFSDVFPFKHEKDPFEDEPFFSFITFHWFNRYIYTGAKKLLSFEDFSPLPSRLKAEFVWKKFSERWKKMTRNKGGTADQNATQEVSRLHLACSLVRAFHLHFSITLIFHVVYVGFSFIPPLLLDALITFMSSDDYVWKGFFFAALLFMSDFLGRVTHDISMFYSEVFSLQARSSLISAVYMKSLKLSSSARREYTCGEMMNHISVDVEKIGNFFSYFGYAFGSPVKLTVSLFLLWQYLGPSCLAGVLVMCVLLVLNMYMIKMTNNVQEKQMETKDARLKFLTEILNGIKVLKLFAWEIAFKKKIMKIRKHEVEWIKKFQLCCAVCCFVWGCAPFIIAAVCFLTFILIDEKNVLDPRIAFVSLNLLNILRDAVSDAPVITGDIIQVFVALRRLEKFLNSEEYDTKIIGNQPDNGEAISIRNATFAWSIEEVPNLKNIDFHVPKGSLIAVIGPVGCGKSSILSAILGEMCKLEGSVDVQGSFAYVPQQAWILNRTLRENILFVKAMNKQKYDKILDACCLRPDLDMLPSADHTEIGEKGVNLSGGQKQRVSLARAIYHDADIYLLDDPLSAVDAHVGKHIFEHVIGKEGLLRKKTRILVTHNISNLHQADCIYTLKDGRIEEGGTYDELMNQGGLFSELIEEYAILEASESEDTDAFISECDEPTSSLPLVERTLSGQTLLKRTLSVESASSTKNKADGMLIEDEKMEIGKVKREAYIKYAKNMSLPLFACVILGFLGREAFEIGANVWLSRWSSDPPCLDGTQDISLRNERIIVYAALGFCQCLAIAFGSLTLAFGAAKASRLFHNHMLDSVIKSPMSFFDTTPLGRIINRFGRDIDEIDMEIPQELNDWLLMLFTVAGTFAIISYSMPLFIAFLFPMMVIYLLIQRVFLLTSRQMKRLMSVSQSPLFSHFAETVQGSSSIRAYGVEKQFVFTSEKKLDTAITYRFYFKTCNRWLELRLAAVGDIIITIAAILAVQLRGSIDVALAALSLSYAFSVNETLNWLVRNTTELENKSVSVERVDEYCKLQSEAPWTVPDACLPMKWPLTGSIEFQNYSTRYRENLNLSLRHINLKISNGEKVGVVGRTGAGKSSLTLALFRILEPVSGTIFIDHVDVSKIGLHQLRSKLTAIPQDPVLFAGPLRNNLDPDECHSDADVWCSLDHANLKGFVKSLPERLNHEVAEGGSNLSVGQRQLICLARALLKKTRVLILDEATAAVDVETDQLIQNTIRNEFRDYTVITVAHRLNTIMDYDRIVVMDVGKIVEVGKPDELLENHESKFYAMARDAGVV